MTKRLLAMLLAAAMICSFMPNVVLAEGEPVVTAHDGSNHKCEHCNATVTWEAWGDTDAEKKSLPKGTADQTTHYYLVSDVTVTGNTSKNNGYALYLSDSEYDGQTYIKGLMKMGGNMIVKDNEGGDLYLPTWQPAMILW